MTDEWEETYQYGGAQDAPEVSPSPCAHGGRGQGSYHG
jgi:hypothetical protein